MATKNVQPAGKKKKKKKVQKKNNGKRIFLFVFARTSLSLGAWQYMQFELQGTHGVKSR